MSNICDYGCGQEANFQLKNGKWCCSQSHNSCECIREIKSERLKGKFVGEQSSAFGREAWNKGKTWQDTLGEKETFLRKKRYAKRLAKYNKERVNPNKGKKLTVEIKRKISNSNKGKVLNDEIKLRISLTKKFCIEDYEQKYPLFTKIEEMRYNPLKEGEIQVHCKNHNCPNSKEQGGWFTPTGTQLYERIRQLEKEYGNGGSYFYCSDECKNECPLFNLKSDPFSNNEKIYTQNEYKTFRETALKRDNYICQYCGELAEHVHHERPQKLEPFHALDPDLAWSVCSKCHYEKGHKDECSTGQLATKICF